MQEVEKIITNYIAEQNLIHLQPVYKPQLRRRTDATKLLFLITRIKHFNKAIPNSVHGAHMTRDTSS